MRALAALLIWLAVLGCAPPTPVVPAPAAVEAPPAVACQNVALAACLVVARDAADALLDDPDPVAYVEVYPEFVAVELADGAGRRQASYQAAADGPTIFDDWVESAAGRLEPASAPIEVDAVPLTLGHCGLASPIDVDGSFWDAVGQIPQVASLINASDGEFRRLGPDEAAYATADARVSLRRHVGAKSPVGCD